MVGILCLLFLLTLAPRTSALPKPGAAELRCFSVTGPDAMDTHLIYYAYITAPDLYKRDDTKLPLQNCSTESGPLELDTCRVCLRGGVIAECYLSHPSAELRFEAVTSEKQLNKTQIPCVVPTAPTTPPPPAPTPTTTTQAPPPRSLAFGYIALIATVVVGLCVAAVVAAVVFTRRRNRRKRVPTNSENGMEMTSRLSVANGECAPAVANGDHPNPC